MPERRRDLEHGRRLRRGEVPVADGGCLPAAVTDRYDDSGAQLEAGEMVENGLELLANTAEGRAASRAPQPQLGPRLLGRLRLRGQLRRLPASSTSPTRRTRRWSSRPSLPGLAERHLRLERPAVPLHGLEPQRRQLPERRAETRRSRRRGRASRSSTSPIWPTRATSSPVETKCGSHTHTLSRTATRPYLCYVSSYSPNANVPGLPAAARPDLDRRGPAGRADHRVGDRRAEAVPGRRLRRRQQVHARGPGDGLGLPRHHRLPGDRPSPARAWATAS